MATLKRGAGYAQLLEDFIEGQYEQEQVNCPLELEWMAKVEERVSVPVAAICRPGKTSGFAVWLVYSDDHARGEYTQKVFRWCSHFREAETLRLYAERHFGISRVWDGRKTDRFFNQN
jgi:hypothetical protein